MYNTPKYHPVLCRSCRIVYATTISVIVTATAMYSTKQSSICPPTN